MSALIELTHGLESLTNRSPDWDFLDTILHTLLVSPSIPENTLEICRHTCSQLLSDDAWLTAAIDPPSCRRLFNVLVNVGNLMYRIDDSISATTQCYVHAIEVIVRKPELCYSPKTTKVSFRDVIIAAWTTAISLSPVHTSSISSHANSLSGGYRNILGRIGDPNFDIVQAVHDAGDDLIGLLLDPTTGNLPSIILFPEQLHRLSTFLFSSPSSYLSEVQAQLAANSSSGMYSQESKTAVASVLLCLARRFQTYDVAELLNVSNKPFCTVEGLSLIMHYLAASLFPNSSTLNDIGVLLCGFCSGGTIASAHGKQTTAREVAQLYYEKGLQLDPTHPHLLSNLGSLMKDAGHMAQAIGIFNRALACHPDLDIALVNMANTLRDMGRAAEAIPYYQRAISVNPAFADAYCGLSQAMNAICCWNGRTIWIQKAIEFCEKHLDTHDQTTGLLSTRSLDDWMVLVRCAQLGRLSILEENAWKARFSYFLQDAPIPESKICGEAGFLIRLVEWFKTRIQRLLYVEAYGRVYQSERTDVTRICGNTTVPISGLLLAMKNSRLPLILPFHTFTLPMTARTIRLIAHRNALYASFTAFTHLGKNLFVHPVPRPPLHGRINVGYISSDFNDHPLTHLMKSVFAMHDKKRFNVFLYATSPTDGSSHRLYYERQDAFHFNDVSSWSVTEILDRITQDQIHILVNLGGYTKGSRNEIFAARPSPVQVSLMGFAGTLAAGWCDYLVCDPIVCPPDLFVQVFVARGRSPGAKPCDISPDVGVPICEGSDPASPNNDWIYSECPIYMPHTYFATDHKQSYNYPSSGLGVTLSRWENELQRRDQLRALIFPGLPKDVIIFANFNQLYKIDPVIFWTWLRILSRVPRSILWLLRFPAAGESNLLQTAVAWAGPEIASRVKFTDIAPKETHIARCCVADLFLDTAECSAHTIAADVLWSGTPIIACLWPSHRHKMASRVSASLAYATGLGKHMVVHNREEYEDRAVALASTCWSSDTDSHSLGQSQNSEREHPPEKSELLHLRRCLFLARETMPLFDTQRWVKNLEKGYMIAWKRWVDGSQFRVGYNNEGAIVVNEDGDGENPDEPLAL